MRFFKLIIILLAAVSCHGPGNRTRLDTDGDTLYHPRYARGFDLLRAGRRSAVLVVRDPWQGARGVEMRVFLSEGGERPPAEFKGTVVEAPLRRVVCMSSSHIAFLDALGCLDLIKGISGAQYVCNPVVIEGVAAGNVKDVGPDDAVNFELLASLKADLVLVYGVTGQSGVISPKGAEMGIRTSYIGDYLETSPLGKAEWLVAIGQMTGRRERAVAIFDSICERYEQVRTLATGANGRPGVMLNSPWRDVWFVPGDSSYFVSLVRDAGGDYLCSGQATRQSRPLSSESAYVYARKSDFWLNPGSARTLAELLADNPRFAHIPPVERGAVWNNNLRLSPGGGSDFWESGAIAPHLILSDMVRIFHPELLPDHVPFYYRQLR